MKFRKLTMYGSLASQARLAQWLPQQNALSSGRLSLARGFQQKKMTKLPRLNESASLSHKYLNKRMSVHPHKMNSFSMVGALREFVWKCIYSMNFDELA